MRRGQSTRCCSGSRVHVGVDVFSALSALALAASVSNCCSAGSVFCVLAARQCPAPGAVTVTLSFCGVGSGWARFYLSRPSPFRGWRWHPRIPRAFRPGVLLQARDLSSLKSPRKNLAGTRNLLLSCGVSPLLQIEDLSRDFFSPTCLRLRTRLPEVSSQTSRDFFSFIRSAQRLVYPLLKLVEQFFGLGDLLAVGPVYPRFFGRREISSGNLFQPQPFSSAPALVLVTDKSSRNLFGTSVQ